MKHVTHRVILKGIAILSSAVCLLTVTGVVAKADDQLTEIIKRGTLRVGVQGAFKPWSFPQTDGTMTGIEVDLAGDVAAKLGVKLEPIIITSANRIQFLEQGKVDLLIAGMYDTAERRKIVGIIEPSYWASGPTLMAKKGVIKDWKGIEGKPVCAKQGVVYNKRVEQEYKARIVAFTGNSEGKEALRSGKCVAWLYDDVGILADLELPEWADYEMPVPVLYNNPWGAAVPIDQIDKPWGVFMSGIAYRWQAAGKLLELEKAYKLKPSDWFSQQNAKHAWDKSYLGGQ
ncbi:transporter substrate-binding domain-containing protein [Neorhizobium alkalisoli]|uniref:transporter substrate-binding domain-containing protein n=1 Tax=Neorhizobium alkalisoli TaxID=528178 RepID=UPI000CF96D7F|nr:transporter substrate-binding domain-containing protein [Neorhizobium alkalisoli]